MKRELMRFCLSLAFLLFAGLGANAQEPYAVLNNDNTTLTFYYDTNKASRGGMSVGPFNSPSARGWDANSTDISTVVFDNSFANYNELTSTAFWFNNCTNLSVIIDVVNLRTNKVVDMACMFFGCSKLTMLDLSKFNTTNVVDMSGMFSGCSDLIVLDVSNFNTEKVTNMSSVFDGCSDLPSLYVNNFNTANVVIMEFMFYGCTGLTNLDVSNFNTKKVRNMKGMFYECKSLISLDVSNFDTSSTTDMSYMFNRSSNLETIYCNDTWTCATSNYMFSGCTSLVGAISYDSNKTDATYANPTTGYFTPKSAIGGKCATPTIFMNNGTLTFGCETEGVVCHYEITRTGEGNTVALSSTSDYVVSVYATKAGYEDSDVVTTTITLKQGDVNGDGVVSISDAVGVVNIIQNSGAVSSPKME